jgi:hypothetical protein
VAGAQTRCASVPAEGAVDRGSLLGVVGSGHGINPRPAPSRSVFLRGEAVCGARVALECGVRRGRLSHATQRRVDQTDDGRQLGCRHRVVGHVSGHHPRSARRVRLDQLGSLPSRSSPLHRRRPPCRDVAPFCAHSPSRCRSASAKEAEERSANRPSKACPRQGNRR